MKVLVNYFAKGLLFVVPVAVTMFVIYAIFQKVDGLYEFRIPGVGFVITLLLITFIGFVTSNFLTRGMIGVIDRMFSRLPLIKMIYLAIRDLVNAFVGDRKRFNRPVAVTLIPGSDLKALGFITRDSLDRIGLHGQVAVYLPQSYNIAGNLIVVPADRVIPLEVSSGDLMALIVSGGVSWRENL